MTGRAVDFLDLFAGGAGGWHYGLAAHGLTSRGLEFDRWAVTSRHAAGHDVLLCDVTAADPHEHATAGLAASPPCRPFSPGGKREGLGDRAVVAQAIDDLAAGHDTRDAHRARCVNPDSLLAAEPMRWIHALRPRTVVMEQVPGVMPLWERYADRMAAWGYSVWTGVLDAADFGLPQNRRRALLAASLDGPVAAPQPTHRVHRSMADALGLPASTVLVSRRDSVGRLAAHGARRNRTCAEPAPTLTGELWRWKWRHVDGSEEPLTLDQAAVLQGFPSGRPWEGPKTRIALQIGNAIPEPLATAAVGAALAAGNTLREAA